MITGYADRFMIMRVTRRRGTMQHLIYTHINRTVIGLGFVCGHGAGDDDGDDEGGGEI